MNDADERSRRQRGVVYKPLPKRIELRYRTPPVALSGRTGRIIKRVAITSATTFAGIQAFHVLVFLAPWIAAHVGVIAPALLAGASFVFLFSFLYWVCAAAAWMLEANEEKPRVLSEYTQVGNSFIPSKAQTLPSGKTIPLGGVTLPLGANQMSGGGSYIPPMVVSQFQSATGVGLKHAMWCVHYPGLPISARYPLCENGCLLPKLDERGNFEKYTGTVGNYIDQRSRWLEEHRLEAQRVARETEMRWRGPGTPIGGIPMSKANQDFISRALIEDDEE